MSEWPMVKLGEVAKVVSGGTPKTSVSEYWDGDIPWVTPKDLSNNKELWISSGSRSITELGLAKSGATLLPSQTVLWSSRAPIGLVAIASNPIATNQGFKSFIPGDKLDSNYLAHFLIQSQVTLQNLGVGATFKEVSTQRAAEIRMPLPSLEEQKRIAEILGKVAESARKLEYEIEMLDSLPLFNWNQKGDTRSLADIVTIRSGTVDPTLAENRKLPLIAPDSIEKGTGRLLKLESCEEAGVISNKYQFQEGDVLYSKIRPYLNKVVIAFCSGLCSSDIYVLKIEKDLTPEVLQALLMSASYLRYAERESSGTSIPRIGRKKLLTYKVPKLSDVQISEITKKIQIVNNTKALLRQKLTLLRELQRSLSARAFAGQL